MQEQPHNVARILHY